jgi:hypothetical protein
MWWFPLNRQPLFKALAAVPDELQYDESINRARPLLRQREI